jgi:hypothetical protein
MDAGLQSQIEAKGVRRAWSEYRLLCYAGFIGVAGGLGVQLFVWL